jgi:hypothetical protein
MIRRQYYVTQACLRAGNRTVGPDFGRTAAGKEPKSDLRPAGGRHGADFGYGLHTRPPFVGSVPVLRVLCLAPFCGFFAWPRFAGSLPGPVLRVPCLAPFCGFLAWPRFAGSSRNPQNEEGSQRGLKFCGFLKEPTKQQRVGTDPTKRRGSPRGPKFYGCTVFTGKFCGFLKEPTKPRGVPEGSLVLRVPWGEP